MTSRMIVLVAAFLCVVLAPVRVASAQSGVPIRASYQGQFLPEGTEIVVLSKEGRVQHDGRFQPEFFPTHDFPRESRKTLRRERLGDAGRSSRTYEGTQDGGRLYFIYALAPDSTLYWSYSAKRDSLKYDVVSSGVMSVAPVPASDVRYEILRSFFRSRITVVMPGDEAREPRSELTEAAIEHTDEARDADPDHGRSEYGLSALVASDSVSPTMEASNTNVRAAAQDSARMETHVPPVATVAARERTASSDVTLPPLLLWSLLSVVAVCVGVPAYLARSFHMELKQVRREMLALRDRGAADADYGGTSTIGRDELRAALDDANLRYEQLEDDYAILQARYDALAREVAA